MLELKKNNYKKIEKETNLIKEEPKGLHNEKKKKE